MSGTTITLRTLRAGLTGAFRRPRRPSTSGTAVLGLALLLPIVLGALIYPWLPLPGPTIPNPADAMQAPSLAHPFGTDRIGRDVFVRTLAGARVSLLVGVTSALLAVTIGIVVGTIAGFSSRKVDGLLMGGNNILLSFPSLLLAIVMVAIFGAGVWQVILAITIADAPQAVRMQRSMVLSLKTRPYMDAARMSAAPTWWLLVRHVVPNTVAPMAVLASIYVAGAIVTESALSFLGLGIVPPTPSWGNIMSDGRAYLREAWWISTVPGIAIVLVAISFHLLSDWLQDRLRVTR
jgi:peptide/nickel transport system permease protein